MKAIVLAGGSGTRLWPLSTEACPKQFLELVGKGSFLHQTLRRYAALPVVTDYYVITKQAYAAQVSTILLSHNPLKVNHLIIEPEPRNTAPAMLLAAKYLLQYTDAGLHETMLIVPSDHYIGEPSQLDPYLEAAEMLARQGKIVTFGIVPTAPEAGYGYIQAGETIETLFENSCVKSHRVACFTEKPSRETASRYIETGGFYWNAGIFCMTIETLFRELAQYAPEFSVCLDWDYDTLYAHFHELPNRSIDYALMEKTPSAAVIPLDISWSDVGSWDSVHELLQQEVDDPKANLILGQANSVESSRCLVINQSNKPVRLIGLEDVMVIQNDDGLLICKKGQSQKTAKAAAAHVALLPLAGELSRFAPGLSPDGGSGGALSEIEKKPASCDPMAGALITMNASLPAESALPDYMQEMAFLEAQIDTFILAMCKPSYHVQQMLKRLCDFGAALGMLCLLSPLLVTIGILIKLTSPGPVFYKSLRIGRNYEKFGMYKFRTMIHGADNHRASLRQKTRQTHQLFKMEDDPRITPLGKILRKFSLDEFPQLLNVIKGDMSLVGPRPFAPDDSLLFQPPYTVRFKVIPGMTGLWQTGGRSSTGFQNLCRLDVSYVLKWHLFLDLVILFRTIPEVFFSKSAY